MIDFDAYRPHVLNDECPNCKGPQFPNLCGPHWEQERSIAALKAGVQALARKAIYCGLIKRDMQCNRCRQFVRLVAHHNDYNKPFDIEWLCGPCHARHHAPERVEANQAKKQHQAQLAAQAEAAA